MTLSRLHDIVKALSKIFRVPPCASATTRCRIPLRYGGMTKERKKNKKLDLGSNWSGKGFPVSIPYVQF